MTGIYLEKHRRCTYITSLVGPASGRPLRLDVLCTGIGTTTRNCNYKGDGIISCLCIGMVYLVACCRVAITKIPNSRKRWCMMIGETYREWNTMSHRIRYTE